MRLESFSNLYNDIQLEVLGVPNPLMLSRARMTVAEVCKRSLISNEALDTHDIDAGEPLVKLCPPNSCVLIWRLMWIKTSQRKLIEQNRLTLASTGTDWDTTEDEWPWAWLPSCQNDIIQLYPKPTLAKADELTPHCAFIPHPDTTKFDKVLYDFYKEMIVQGTVAKLQRMAGMPWFNAGASITNNREYQRELQQARANQNKDNSIADTAVIMSPMA